jgi:hypothetical protein
MEIMGRGRLQGSGGGDEHDDCIDGSLEAFLGSYIGLDSEVANLWAFICLNYNTLGPRRILYRIQQTSLVKRIWASVTSTSLWAFHIIKGVTIMSEDGM